MKKKFILGSVFISLFALVSCGSQNVTFDSNKPVEFKVETGELSSFDLVNPTNGSIVSKAPEFSWGASQHAISYTLEVCTREDFEHESSEVSYIKETNISTLKFNISTDLKVKNTTYYWRVTAINNFNTKFDREKISNQVYSFFFKAPEVSEIDIPIGEDGEWTLHPEGSYADISVDNNNYFGGDEPDSLNITFEKENTKRGVESSDGWIVITKTNEMDLYGTDSIYFNFYYSGNDSNIFLRFIDQDGEYWYNEIKISRNAKQSVLMKFTDFTLRTKDTPVINEIFNYEHIQAIEIVFERTFGDGCCLISNFKAVNYKNYGHLFLEKFDFNSFKPEEWIYESYHFAETVSQDGSELNLAYKTTASGDNPKGIGSYGYGFTKIVINRYFAGGNAMKMKVKYNGYKDNSSKIIVRIYEEDTDRWSYEQPFSALVADEYFELTIPFRAFAKSQTLGDGNRQMYFIINVQFGASGIYGNGSVSFKDVEIVTIPSATENRTYVDEDGIIEDFDDFTYRAQMYEAWENSIENKDESMALSSSEKFFDGKNVNTGDFAYKSDMGMASYDTYLTVNYTGGNALKLWIKDASQHRTDIPVLSYLTPEEVTCTFVIQIAMKDGRWYRYSIDQAPRQWTQYVISFSDFTLFSGSVTPDSSPVLSEYVANFAFGMQYFYYTQDGKAYPIYTESNHVYVDTIAFTKADSTTVTPLNTVIEPEQDNPNVTKIDEFEYASEEQLKTKWFGTALYSYEKVELSDDVSSQGGSHSMKLDYKGGENSPSYATYPVFSTACKGRAISIDIKGDNNVTVYINIYVKSGTSTKQVRATLNNVANTWNRYVIGFDKSLFAPVGDTTFVMSSALIPDIARITIGLVDWNHYTSSSIYVDNVKFDFTPGYKTNTVTAL